MGIIRSHSQGPFKTRVLLQLLILASILLVEAVPWLVAVFSDFRDFKGFLISEIYHPIQAKVVDQVDDSCGWTLSPDTVFINPVPPV